MVRCDADFCFVPIRCGAVQFLGMLIIQRCERLGAYICFRITWHYVVRCGVDCGLESNVTGDAMHIRW